MMIRVTVWNEFEHERKMDEVRAIYPDGIHAAIAGFLCKQEGLRVRTATLEMPEHGLTDDVLADTDVLIWWSHAAQHKVSDAVADKVRDCVLRGMGLIVLHSAQKSKPFLRLMGTSGCLLARDNDRERLWCCNPTHPIAKDVPPTFALDCEEMYGEFFDIPQPDELVYLGWFKGGEVFRSGCTFRRGYGKIFYFQPGHETSPTYHNPNIQRILTNAVFWAKPDVRWEKITSHYPQALEE